MDTCPPCRQTVAAVARDRCEEQAPAVDPGTLVPGDLLADRYRIVKSLGRGGMASVYEAEDLELCQRVALKLVRSESDAPSERRAIRREMILGRRVTHTNVCRVYDVDRWSGRLFISMALVRGESLDRLIRTRLVSATEAIDILLQVARALEAAHLQGVVHRDLKPANIMIDDDRRITVLDFGLSRDLHAETRGRELAGTPSWWSPEQASGREADERSDLYALGLIACELFGVERFDPDELTAEHASLVS